MSFWQANPIYLATILLSFFTQFEDKANKPFAVWLFKSSTILKIKPTNNKADKMI